jgi:hypothetical protein
MVGGSDAPKDETACMDVMINGLLVNLNMALEQNDILTKKLKFEEEQILQLYTDIQMSCKIMRSLLECIE